MRQLKDIGWGGRGREFDPPPLHQFTDILRGHGNVAFCFPIVLKFGWRCSLRQELTE